MYPREFYMLIFFNLTAFIAYETTIPILPLYIVDKGATRIEVGLIVGMFSFTLMVSKIPIGILTDRVGGKYLLIFSALAQCICQLSYSILPSINWFYPIRILHALSISNIVPLAIGKIQDYTPQGKTGETLGTFLTSYGLAITFGPFLCSTLLTVMTYSQIFQFAAIIPVLGLIPFIKTDSLNQFRRQSDQKSVNSVQSLNDIFHSRNLMILTFLRLFFGITYAFFITYFVLYAKDTLAIAPYLIAFLFGMRGITDLIIRIPVGKLIDKIDYRWCLYMAFCLLAIVYFLMSEISEPYLLIVLAAVYGPALGLRVVSEWTMLVTHSSSDARNVTAAYLSTIFHVGSGIGAVAGGVLTTFLEVPILLKFSSVLMLSSLILIFLIHDNKSIPTNDQLELKREVSQ
ncbi:MAG: MFS transporter [Candidatus Hodarchaeales archaeon]|jgi:predicted MFS family arabinose efflux permease